MPWDWETVATGAFYGHGNWQTMEWFGGLNSLQSSRSLDLKKVSADTGALVTTVLPGGAIAGWLGSA